MSTFRETFLNIVSRRSVANMTGGLECPLIRPLPGSSTINFVGGLPNSTDLTTATGTINVSGSAPPSNGDTLRTVDANSAEWLPSAVQVSDLPSTGVIADTYDMPQIVLNDQGRITNAVSLYTAGTPFNFTPGTNVASITIQDNFFTRIKDGVRVNLNIALSLVATPSVVNFSLNGLPVSRNTNIPSAFGNVVIIRDTDLVSEAQLSYGVATIVNGSDVLDVALSFNSGGTKINLQINGDIFYNVSDINVS